MSTPIRVDPHSPSSARSPTRAQGSEWAEAGIARPTVTTAGRRLCGRGRLVKQLLTYGSVVARAQVSGCWTVATRNTALQPYG
jgi:hypothetical protein